MLGKHQGMLITLIVLEFINMSVRVFKTNFWQIFASLAPTDISLTLFLVEMTVAKKIVLEKHITILRNLIILELFCFK